MSLRFRKSIKIMPGIKVNIGRNGFSSITVGAKGTSMSFGKNGTHVNASLSGTGISFRNKIGGSKQPNNTASANAMQAVEINVAIEDDGSVRFKNQDGAILPNSIVSKIWQNNGESLTNYLKEWADKFNDVDVANLIQHDIPLSNQEPIYKKAQFVEEMPKQPIKSEAKKPFFLLMIIFTKIKEKYNNELSRSANEYQDAMKKYNSELEEWSRKKDDFDRHQQELYDNYKTLIRTNIGLMVSTLEDTLQKLQWPRETNISFEITNDVNKVWIDTDLPEIEDLPRKAAFLAASGKRLNIKDKPNKQLSLEYAKLIHAIALRIAAYTFSTLPATNIVILSGFSQRLDASTGRINDEYLYSVKFARDVFSEIDFNNLELLDPIMAFTRFENIRNMSTTGIFKPIKPFKPLQAELNKNIGR